MFRTWTALLVVPLDAVLSVAVGDIPSVSKPEDIISADRNYVAVSGKKLLRPGFSTTAADWSRHVC